MDGFQKVQGIYISWPQIGRADSSGLYLSSLVLLSPSSRRILHEGEEKITEVSQPADSFRQLDIRGKHCGGHQTGRNKNLTKGLMDRSSTDIAKNTNARSRDPASYLSLDVRSKFLETKPSQLLTCLYVVSGMNGGAIQLH